MKEKGSFLNRISGFKVWMMRPAPQARFRDGSSDGNRELQATRYAKGICFEPVERATERNACT